LDRFCTAWCSGIAPPTQCLFVRRCTVLNCLMGTALGPRSAPLVHCLLYHDTLHLFSFCTARGSGSAPPVHCLFYHGTLHLFSFCIV
jgi:hypothetical protein